MGRPLMLAFRVWGHASLVCLGPFGKILDVGRWST